MTPYTRHNIFIDLICLAGDHLGIQLADRVLNAVQTHFSATIDAATQRKKCRANAG